MLPYITADQMRLAQSADDASGIWAALADLDLDEQDALADWFFERDIDPYADYSGLRAGLRSYYERQDSAPAAHREQPSSGVSQQPRRARFDETSPEFVAARRAIAAADWESVPPAADFTEDAHTMLMGAYTTQRGAFGGKGMSDSERWAKDYEKWLRQKRRQQTYDDLTPSDISYIAAEAAKIEQGGEPPSFIIPNTPTPPPGNVSDARRGAQVTESPRRERTRLDNWAQNRAAVRDVATGTVSRQDKLASIEAEEERALRRREHRQEMSERRKEAEHERMRNARARVGIAALQAHGAVRLRPLPQAAAPCRRAK